MVVFFDLDLMNTEIARSGVGVPMYIHSRRMWSVTMDELRTMIMGLLNRSSLSADPASLRLLGNLHSLM